MSEVNENNSAIEEITEEKEKAKELKKAEKEKKKAEKLEAKRKKKNKEDSNESDEKEVKEASSEENDDKEELEETDKSKKKKKKNKKNPDEVNIVKDLLSLIIYIGAVVLLCYIIITYVGCRSRVDGDSMNNTLQNNDNLWVDKLSYTFGKPDRFDIVIFNYDEDTTYVKRIIGLPGETVRIDQNGNIFINEMLLEENFGKEKIRPEKLGRANQPVVLGEDEYFVLGDNRNNSSDSRWPDVGNVNKEDIVGKVVIRITPISKIGIIK